jgi:hypothetical protein
MDYAIKAKDGEVGSISNLLYQESDWTIRWVVADTGDWLSGKRVLLPVSALGALDPEAQQLSVNLTMAQIEGSPDIDGSDPLSQEIDLLTCTHYNLRSARADTLRREDERKHDSVLPDRGLQIARSASTNPEGGQDGIQARSLSAITGNALEATDGEIGHSEDFLIDPAHWQVRYLVVHTSSWWPGEKRLISPQSIDWIDWARSIIHLDVTCQKVKDSPPYAATATVDGAFDELFGTYFGIHWVGRS